MKIVSIKYKTPGGKILEHIALKTKKGYRLSLFEDTYLDKLNKIISEKVLEYE